MSDLGETMHRMRIAEDGSAISGTITRVDAFGSFNSGWIGQDYLYELPELFITCETDFGTIQLESHIKNFEKSGIAPFLNNSEEITLKNGVDLTNLVGEKIYIAPDDEKFQATIGTDSTVRYDDNHTVIFRTDKNLKDLDSIEVDSRFETGFEPKPIDWMNSLLTDEYHRYAEGTHGWIEVAFNYYGEANDHHFFTATLPSGETVYWAFETHMSGVEKIDKFLSEVGIDYTPAEFDEETVWVKPLRDIHFTNRPEESELRIDTDEFWVADAKPRLPEKNQTLFEKISSFFSDSSGGVEVSMTKGRERRAKSSRTKEVLRPNSKDSQQTASKEVEQETNLCKSFN